MIPQHKLEVWPGYVTAVSEYEGGLMLNCDVSHKVLRSQTARDLLVDIHKQDKNKVVENAQKALIGAIVLTRYNNKTYKIDDVDFNASPSSKFNDHKGKTIHGEVKKMTEHNYFLTSGGEISFVDYYKRQYNIDIKESISRFKKFG